MVGKNLQWQAASSAFGDVNSMDIETGQILAEPALSRRLMLWFMNQAGNPRIAIRLWNGDEFAVTDASPVATAALA